MYKIVKRMLDLILSLLAAAVLSPVLAVISVAVKLDSKGPILFSQKRIGANKQTFMMHKFRTMKIDTPHDTPTHLLKDPEAYITKVGKFLRKYSLDELPQIFNIIKGEMSVVGPRPALWNQFDLITERDKYGANNIKPGLTGWAQINGRDELQIKEKAAYDGEYVGKMSLMFDAKCIIETALNVIRHEGVVEGGTGNCIASK
ncbi:MAG: sugar transferase [Clostridiales bacterium]|nr:sugar transferase [Clostridiales bacterium]